MIRIPSRTPSSKDNWAQDEYVETAPLNENELKGSRQKHDREHYGSARPFQATTDEYPLRRSFEGVGPRNYKRTDDRIEEEVCNVLMKDRYVDASDIEVHVRNGIVTLSGTVESRMEKIAAEMAIEGITGVEDVQNQIKLKRWGDYSDRPYRRDSLDRNPRGDRDKETYY